MNFSICFRKILTYLKCDIYLNVWAYHCCIFRRQRVVPKNPLNSLLPLLLPFHHFLSEETSARSTPSQMLLSDFLVISETRQHFLECMAKGWRCNVFDVLLLIQLVEKFDIFLKYSVNLLTHQFWNWTWNGSISNFSDLWFFFQLEESHTFCQILLNTSTPCINVFYEILQWNKKLHVV